ncbi:MAG TPA: SRPBCC family protein [Solirubrobacteraceae bacterium]|nr:SRPBCC family protein [Solirubrobacteraceae bacterium]
MARYRATLETPRSPEEVFRYLSDFSTTREWDPGVITAERLTDGTVGMGSEFSLVARFLGRDAQLTYRVVEYDPPHAVTVLGENATVISRDRITFEPSGGGTRITYDAELTLRGVMRLADPLLGLAFRPVGDRALEGMKRALSAERGALAAHPG